MSERLGRVNRLVRGDEVRRVLGRGTRVRSAYLDIAWLVNSAGHPRLGLVVPKFQSNAVARNRLRRRLKELWRRVGLSSAETIDVVFRAKPEAYRADFRDLGRAVEDWLATMRGGQR